MGPFKLQIFNLKARGTVRRLALSLTLVYGLAGMSCSPEFYEPEQGEESIRVDLLEPNFPSIYKYVFVPKCIKCHVAGAKGKNVLLDKDSLLESPLELIIPGNADESGLILSLERTDRKRMPPAKDGYRPLQPEVIEVIREWIDKGAL